MSCSTVSLAGLGPKLLTGCLVAALSTALACTGGRITKAGASVPATNVDIWTCNAIGDFNTTTDVNGIYTFNPYSSTSSAIDNAKYVPQGPIAILVAGAAGSSVTRRNHQYNQTCDITYNNAVQSLPCKREDVSLVPMTWVEFNAATLAFFDEDCGLSADHTPAVAHALSQLHPPPEQYSCLADCSHSCGGPGVPYGEFSDCMCICVEALCHVSYGPACVEAIPEQK